jgi:1,4-dihydroxy-2-naphthoate octaprenyltransferase
MKNIILHLRLPFSLFLLPIYLFALSQAAVIDSTRAWWVFFILHLLVFPSSNAYNSYHDKDEGSIGLLETPPPVTKSLLFTANVLDLLAIVLGFLFVGQGFTIYLVAYITMSRAYSSPLIRLKKYPIISWLIVCVFQGALTYLAVFEALTLESEHWTLESNIHFSFFIFHFSLPALICTSNLLAIYPLTQVYQHAEDAARGDMTMSRLLGIKGTFINAFVWLGLSGLGYWFVFDDKMQFLILTLLLFPVVAFLGVWTIQVWKDERQANFKMTMWLNILASLCLNLFFGILYFLNH